MAALLLPVGAIAPARRHHRARGEPGKRDAQRSGRHLVSPLAGCPVELAAFLISKTNELMFKTSHQFQRVDDEQEDPRWSGRGGYEDRQRPRISRQVCVSMFPVGRRRAGSADKSNGSRDRDPLPLAAGDLVGQWMQPLLEVEQCEARARETRWRTSTLWRRYMA
jgi:hypothetical protein